MSTANDLGQDFIKTEIDKVNSRLEVYYALYNIRKIKCITLKRLINVKEEELRQLMFLDSELIDKKE